MGVLNYATLSQLKEYLWVSGTSEDMMLTLLLDSTYRTLNSIIGVDSMNLTTGTEAIELSKVYNNAGYYGYNVFLKNKPVTAITKIGGKNYTGVKGTDYMLVYERKAVIKDLYEYISDINWDTFEIEYTRWYDRDLSEGIPGTSDTLPDDLKLMQMMLVSGKYNAKGMEGIKSYVLWDEKIEFGSINGQSADDAYFSFKMMIDKYKTFNLP